MIKSNLSLIIGNDLIHNIGDIGDDTVNSVREKFNGGVFIINGPWIDADAVFVKLFNIFRIYERIMRMKIISAYLFGIINITEDHFGICDFSVRAVEEARLAFGIDLFTADYDLGIKA